MSMAGEVLERQEAELARAAAVEVERVVAQFATGNGHIDQVFSLGTAFRLVYVRCHFAGAAGTNDLSLAIDSAAGSAYDALLATVKATGTGADANFRVPGDETHAPSDWTFGAGDAVWIRWTNPAVGSITWGLEVGLALAR
jgi:hypothetical protein